jgi:hypothetical protein
MAHHEVLNHLKQTKNEKNVWLELERGLQLFFQKKLKQNITHPLPLFAELLLYS